MKVNYRDHEIVVEREKCLAGYELMYYTIFRNHDGYCVECSYDETSDTVWDYLRYMKQRLDSEIEEGSTYVGVP